MTVLKYLMSTGVCTTSELIAFKKQDADGSQYRALAEMARQEMATKGIEIEEAEKK